MLALLFTRNSPTIDTQPFDTDSTRVRCPRCAWQPQKHDRWLCDPGCHHRWNTFDTAGVCPGCGKAWDETACLRCHAWSPHADWYERSGS